MHKTVKLEIPKSLDTDWNTFGQILRDLQYETWKAMNKTIQLMWECDNMRSSYKDSTGLYPTKEEMKEWSNYSGIDGYVYHAIKNDCPTMSKGNLTQTRQQAAKRWKTDRKDIWNGKKSIPSYRRTAPINIHPSNIKNNRKPYQTDKGWAIDIGLIGKEKAKELDRKNGVFPLAIIARDASSKSILNRLVSGEYKAAGSKIIRDRRKRKWFLLLTYSFEQKDTDLLLDNVMGIDMGVVIPFYLAFNNSPARYHIGGGEIEQFRRGIEARRRSMLKQGKYCGEGRKGHGRSTKMKPIDKLTNKVDNFKDTTNHKYSRFIVDMAIRHKCATIQMEDLSGITDNTNRFLKNWTYFDLQTKVEYKAKEVGIEIVKVDPSYTSQMCSNCGHISRENRETQADFICVVCGCKENADYNAAKNISIPGIEDIIKEQLASQGKEHHESRDAKDKQKNSNGRKNGLKPSNGNGWDESNYKLGSQTSLWGDSTSLNREVSTITVDNAR